MSAIQLGALRSKSMCHHIDTWFNPPRIHYWKICGIHKPKQLNGKLCVPVRFHGFTQDNKNTFKKTTKTVYYVDARYQVLPIKSLKKWNPNT